MLKDQMLTLDEGKDVLKSVGVPEDDMAALERQLVPSIDDSGKDDNRKVGFVSAGVQPMSEAMQHGISNKEDIELPEESESEEDEKVEISQKDVPDAVYGGLVRKRDESENTGDGSDVAPSTDKEEGPVGALERMKRARRGA